MIKKMLTLVFALMLVAVGFGCGGRGETPPELENAGAITIDDPAVQRALDMEQAGEHLSGKEKAVLEDAREAGIIPEAAGE